MSELQRRLGAGNLALHPQVRISSRLMMTPKGRKSTLTLLVLRVVANNPHDALAENDFALIADGLYGRANLHDDLTTG